MKLYYVNFPPSFLKFPCPFQCNHVEICWTELRLKVSENIPGTLTKPFGFENRKKMTTFSTCSTCINFYAMSGWMLQVHGWHKGQAGERFYFLIINI